MRKSTGWFASALAGFLFAACGGGGVKNDSGSMAGAGPGGTGGGGGSGGSAGGTAGSAGGTAGSAGGVDAGDGSAGADGGLANTVGTSGGTVSDATGNLTLVIPSGALLGDTRFTFTPQATLGGLPSDHELLDGSGYRIDWTAAGFASGATIKVRISVPATLAMTDTPPEDGDRLESPFPIIMVQCADGTWVEYGAILVNAGTFEQDVAPVCLDGGPGTVRVGVGMATGPLLPVITQQPASVTVGAGDPAGFAVVATGAAPLVYQWRRNGTNIAGAGALSYTLTAAQASDSGDRFSVIVSNRYGSVNSDDAALTVGPPRIPTWTASTPLGAFGPGIDLPQTGSLAGLDFVVWNDNGTLHAKTSGAGGYPPIDMLAEPARGRPKVLTGGNLLGGFIVFVDDSGTSACTNTFGDRLSAVAVRIGPEGQLLPRSSRFSLYQSTGDCIAQFSAGLIDTDATTARPIAFALSELTAGQLKVGSGGALQDAAGGWSYTQPASTVLNVAAACGGVPYLTDDSLEGRRQSFPGAAVPATTAVLAWVANENLCAATLDGGSWSQGSVVFDRAIGDPAIGPPDPVVAIDSVGNGLVVASRVVNPAIMPYTQEMTAGFRAAAGGAWALQAVDSSGGIATPSAAFTASGNALVVWRPSLPAAPTTVYAAVRSAAGAWQLGQPISASAAADTRFPRICVDAVGSAVVVYQEKAGASDPFRVWARLWNGGAWSMPGRVQDTSNEGRFAACVRHELNAFLGSGVYVAWRETDPSDATRFRIVAAH